MAKNRQTEGPRARIVDAAVDLFYREGYANTTVDRIIAESGAYKKSFYRYFPARADLGREYLRKQGFRFLTFLETLTARHDGFEQFWRAWMRWLKRDVRAGHYLGCPFAGFASQARGEMDQFQDEMDHVVARWRAELSAYLRGCRFAEGKLPPEQAIELTDGIMMLYEGAVALFGMTGDEAYIKRLEVDGLRLARGYLNRT